ncbi:MAG: hypothetical protein AVDCRST_MAG64-3588 [uncultured Phycisphaerae bacterium]|uniref:Uncharacterized protein n=1 Tax=uncultured Phycisphaerae bacterium TaxID=904963 RepID=A0A6J4Q3Y1_9BACT|nr:MAG: hypothetical protein AVDCRST_MAG64-3588 [uncultured Phycisphaerae bacterium]
MGRVDPAGGEDGRPLELSWRSRPTRIVGERFWIYAAKGRVQSLEFGVQDGTDRRRPLDVGLRTPDVERGTPDAERGPLSSEPRPLNAERPTPNSKL